MWYEKGCTSNQLDIEKSYSYKDICLLYDIYVNYSMIEKGCSEIQLEVREPYSYTINC